MKIVAFLFLILCLSCSAKERYALQKGVAVSVPVYQSHHQQFDFKIGGDVYRCLWYGRFNWVHAGEVWQLMVSLKPLASIIPRRGFDYGAYLKHKDYAGSCSVHYSTKNKRVGQQAWAAPLSVMREQVRFHLYHYIHHLPMKGLILALLLGDRSGISKANWRVFQRTGTSHLVAISGLHVGLVAMLSYVLFLRIFACSYRLAERGVVPLLSTTFSFLVCLSYSALAGFSVPTTRAMLMISIVMLASACHRALNYSAVLAIAFVLLLLTDFSALYFAGAWLSFAAVYFLILGQRAYQPKCFLSQITVPQFAIFIGLLPLTLYWFGRISIVAMLVNILAIPYMSFTVVPLLLLGLVTMPIHVVAMPVFTLANSLLLYFWEVLSWFASFKYAAIQVNHVSLCQMLSGTVGAIIMIKRWHWSWRLLGVGLFLLLFA